MTCLRKAAKGKDFWMFATLFIKTKQTQCQWPALLVWPPQSVRIVTLIFRRKFPRLKLVSLSMEQVFLKPCSEMTIISHLSAKSIADHYFKCTQTSWDVCTRPPGVQLWVRINSDYRWTTDLTLINLPPDFHLKKDAGGDLTNDQKQTAVFPVGRLFRLLFVSRLSKHGWTADGRLAAKTANAHVCVVSLDVSLRENSVICFVQSPKSGTMFITRFVIWPSTMTWCSVLKCLPFTPKILGGDTPPASWSYELTLSYVRFWVWMNGMNVSGYS